MLRFQDSESASSQMFQEDVPSYRVVFNNKN